jgi:hypothetical protein
MAGVASAAGHRVQDADGGVADLVQAARLLGQAAVRDVLALDVHRPAPLAVVAAVEAEVEPRADRDPGIAEHFDHQRPPRAVLHAAVEFAAEQTAILRVEAQGRHDVGDLLFAAVRVLDAREVF